uniref:DNA-directed RNA polymerase n=1 Tax=Bursaphelenchus xylophilus TaxID=6326 RepID=A0A1I7RZK7_BURXY
MLQRAGIRVLRCSNCRFIRHSTALPAGKPKDVVEKESKTKKDKISATRLEWEQKIADFLSTELKKEHKRYSNEKKRKRIEHIVICHIRDEKLVPLLGFLARLTQSKEVIDGSADYGEIFTSALKHVSHFLSTKSSDFEFLRSQEAIPFFHNLFEVLPGIPLTSNDVTGAVAFCLAKLDEVKILPEEVKEQRERVVPGIQRRLTMVTTSHLPKQNRIFFNDPEFDIIKEYIQRGFDRIPREEPEESIKYGNCPLAESLNAPCSEEEYQGNPFITQSWTKQELKQRIRELLLREQNYCIAVENFARNSIERPMEVLLKEWQWKEAIQNTFEVMRGKVSQVNVTLFINGLNPEKVSERLFEVMNVALCTGQKVLAIPELETALAHSILDLAHSEFTSNVLKNSSEIFAEVFEEFLRYFERDSELPRTYSLREWWHKSAAKARVDPNFHVPLGGVSKASTEELGSFLLSVVMNSCFVPPNKLRRSDTMTDLIQWQETYHFASGKYQKMWQNASLSN